jgi:hypothetical protein
MNKIIDQVRIMKANHSTDVIYLERIVENETGKFVEIHIEDGKIMMYHKVTGGNKGEYLPSEQFTELCQAFIEDSRPSLKLGELHELKAIFEKYGVPFKYFN